MCADLASTVTDVHFYSIFGEGENVGNLLDR